MEQNVTEEAFQGGNPRERLRSEAASLQMGAAGRAGAAWPGQSRAAVAGRCIAFGSCDRSAGWFPAPLWYFLTERNYG